MSTRATTELSDRPGPSRPAVSMRDPWFPEGAAVPLLLVAYIGLAAYSVQAGGWTNLVVPMGLIGVAAALVGTLIAKLRLVDSLAHLFSLVTGIGLVYASVLFQAEALGERLRDRIEPLASFLLDWYMGKRPPDEHEALLISMLMGLIVWLIGYLASWTLFRRGWLFAAISLPGFLVLVNLAYAPEPRPWLIAVMVAIAIPLAARYTLYQRQQRWARQRLAGPQGLASRLLVITTVIALVVTGASWQAPATWSQTVFAPVVERIETALTSTQRRATEWLEETAGGEGSTRRAGPYTSFDDAFSVGGPLELSDQPEVLVQTEAASAPYLTAHRYDLYTGRGWASSIDDQFQAEGPDGKLYAPELTFREGQEVVLSDAVTAAREELRVRITPLAGPSDVVLSIETYLTSDIRTAVRMSWRQLADEPYPLSADALLNLPPDLQRIGSLLVRSELTGEVTPYGSMPADAERRAEIEEELDNLASRFLQVRWSTNAEGVVDTLYVTGQMPVYDDVEAVFPRTTPGHQPGDTYGVAGLTSVADATALMEAGTEYPAWVEDRYLQLGETVTPRTIELALSLTADAATPYEKAVAVEQYLRDAIAYDETVTAPPDGRDIVDYVLFEDPRGYCEHYASAMTVMLRALGVPARTVVGYYPGEYDDARGGYLYLQRNAHAWTEVYFPGYGWIPFEPTAGRPLPDREAQAGEAVAPQEPTPTPEADVPTEAPDAPPATPAMDAPPLDGSDAPQMTTVDDEDGRSAWLFPLAASFAIGALALGGGWLIWMWRLRGMPPSAALFERLRRLGRLVGVSPSAVTTPREYADAFSHRVPAAARPAHQIVRVYELDQYGPDGADSALLAGAADAWRRLRRQFPRMILRRRGAR